MKANVIAPLDLEMLVVVIFAFVIFKGFKFSHHSVFSMRALHRVTQSTSYENRSNTTLKH